MKNPQSYYTERIKYFGQQEKAVKKNLVMLSVFRLLSFLVAVAVVYLFWGNMTVLLPVLLFCLGVFLVLISKYDKAKYQKDKIRELISINDTELKVLRKEFYFLDDGHEFVNPEHDFSHDIDLFGPGSFFQYSNRTATQAGKQLLANIYTENTVDSIPLKQQAIQELGEKVDWRQEYSAVASLVNTEISVKTITSWLHGHQPIVKGVVRWLPWVFSICSVVIFTLVFLNVIPSTLVLYWFFLGLGITGIFVKRISLLADYVSKVLDTFQQYHQLIAIIEKASFKSEWLRAQQEIVLGKEIPTSQVIKKFSKALDALEQRNNLLIAVPANAFLLLDIFNAYRIEKWILKHKNEVGGWFRAVAFFDAYNSLGNVAFNHPTYTFPEISNIGTIIEAKDLGHPLIDENKLVYNDFRIDENRFFVITGANMAGKSTFLRTVSLHIVMANCGLPVCANSSVYGPIKLITSMRTIDSLTDDASYFYAELKRLKHIVDKIQTDTYFIVLDEILKGTNSKDKAIGSRKFIEKLSATGSTGIIATHDLSLCEVANENDDVKNYFFEAFINGKELTFDYTLKEGICENMNASFLLKNMGIVE